MRFKQSASAIQCEHREAGIDVYSIDVEVKRFKPFSELVKRQVTAGYVKSALYTAKASDSVNVNER